MGENSLSVGQAVMREEKGRKAGRLTQSCTETNSEFLIEWCPHL